MKKDIAIIKFPNSNIQSIVSSLEYLNYKPVIIETEGKLKNFGNLLIPGVGSFKSGMKFLKEKNLDLEISNFVKKGDKILLVCLGMQVFLDQSEEFGKTKGLSIISGNVKKFENFNTNLGWNEVYSVKNNGIRKHFYFVHSYYCDLKDKKLIHSFSNNKNFEFCSSYHKDNILGCQFHPEKSGKNGLSLIKSFFDGKNIKTL